MLILPQKKYMTTQKHIYCLFLNFVEGKGEIIL